MSPPEVPAAPPAPEESPSSAPPVGWYERHWRWFVLAVLFYATFLNYLDRQTLATALEPISREFGLDNIQRGRLLASFIYVYAFCHIFIGFLLDRVHNVRRFFPLMLLGWSLCTVAVAGARSYQEVLYLRYLLGVFESVNFPLCYLILARIFPSHQRAFAAGVFASGAVFATMVAPKLVIFFSHNLGWRAAFVVNGTLGLTWLVPWLLIFRHPERRAQLWPAAQPAGSPAVPRPPEDRLGAILRRPAFWMVAAIGIGTVPGSYFTSQWLPTYFTQAWGVDYNQALGNRLVLIYLMQDLGAWLGGGLVWILIRRGWPVLTARKSVVATGFLLALSMMLLPATRSLSTATVLIAIYVFGLAMWGANNGAFKQEVHRGRVATVSALVGFLETTCAAFVVARVGDLTQRTGGFGAVFLLLGLCLTAAFLVVLLGLRERRLQL